MHNISSSESKKSIFKILLILNFVAITVAASFNLFKGEYKFLFFGISIMLSLSLIAYSLLKKMASPYIYLIYSAIALAIFIFQYYNRY